MRVFITAAVLFTLAASVTAERPKLIGVIEAQVGHTEFGGVILPAGDQNQDGFDDLLVYERVLRRTYLFPGGMTTSSIPLVEFDSTGYRSRVLKDIRADGSTDFAIPSVRRPFKLNLYHGGASLDSTRDLWFGSDTLYAIGPAYAGNDLDNNGVDELITTGSRFRSVLFFELGPDSDSLWDRRLWAVYDTTLRANYGDALAVGDINGDGANDLAVSLLYSSTEIKKSEVHIYYGGALFDTLPDVILREPGEYVEGMFNFGRVMTFPGDMNADGYEDLFVSADGALDDSLSYLYFGGPNFDTIPDVIMPLYIHAARPCGDINNDGVADLIVSRVTTLSSVGYVAIYYGGPEVDSIPDVFIDIKDMPGYHDHFGRAVSGIGDYNGDGIDDFAFSAEQAAGLNVVYLFAGWDSTITDVPYTHEATIPDKLVLHQNYPNPFNPSTTIEFELPHQSRVTLGVFNMLGQRVRMLFDRELPAGRITVEWDGRTDGGRLVASGTYLYRLTAGEVVLTRKMVVVK